MNFNFHNDSIRGVLRSFGHEDAEVDNIETFVTFARLANGIFREMDTDLTKLGASQGRIIVLSLLHCHAPHRMTPSELAEKADVTRGTMTGLIDGLERDGMIERVAHESDGRMVTVGLKEAGRELLSKIVPYYTKLIRSCMSEFTPQDHKMMKGLLGKMKNGFERSLPKS
ncbi:MarR family winged helix-turn-helix transcriptional regulator [Paenibacillus polymyxa]|jgi:DNA-binding MarR family transcriptional regulator|uniref:MarR family winged helix-turn-helix transcriptional regulator n=1 Tax=Paenibacillus TaxID=44249 RepID=UPI0003046DD4|nr:MULTISPECIES: MarR family transcriptional regulator [Paenibacillus]AHM68445.1 MarR family transcriptional regulator [Paenibacillus polymyxa SQR-21]AIY09164.1 transcriptional regulator [Paenibacillus polymyxa]AUS29099.1 transcriptional regulator [Paenibacillus polymyxa]KAE8561177.1 transcriptional regulator [Paenibacillus polymyxa]KAF6587139.1 MarR family transcriptional regulator [Paenibacillus sp. EKM211P]